MSATPLFLAQPDWVRALAAASLDAFDPWWALRLEEVEPGNQRRGGWSAVCRYRLAPDIGLYVKRQENHVRRCWRHPLRGCLTGALEFDALQRCRAAGVAAAEPILYAEQHADGHRRGVLVTRELAGYRALEDLIADWQQHGWPGLPQRKRLLHAVAMLIRRLHRAHLEHNCLYPKHLMVHAGWLAGADVGDIPPVALIDLEKCKWRWQQQTCARRDLDSLHRRSAGWSRADRRRFMGYYLNAERRLDRSGRRLWRRLARLR